MNNSQKDFCKEFGLTEGQFNGKETILGNLWLNSVTEIPKGFNPTVGGDLWLNSFTEIPKGFNPTVGGDMYLDSVTKIPKGFNPTVGGGLYLNSVTEIPKGFNPTVGGYLCLNSVTKIPKGFNPTVGGGLYLNSVTEIPKGFNPTVGGGLYLNSVTEIPKGFNPTVGGGLCLNSVTKIPKGFNPTVGGGLYTKNESRPINKVIPLLSWQNGRYISVDGMFVEVVNKRGKVYRVKKIHQDKIFYVVTDGEKWAHGETLKEAREDLIYKVSDRKKEDYKDLPLTHVLTFEEAVTCYRVITGACSFGVKDFVSRNPKAKKGKYTIQEIIDVTKGEYGSQDFKTFFTGK